MTDKIKRAAVFIVWFFFSYGVILALSPLVYRLAPGGGVTAFFLYTLIGLGMSAFIPFMSAKFKALLKVSKSDKGGSLEEQLQRRPASGLTPIGELAGYEILGLLERGPWWSCFVARKPGSLTSFSLTLPRSEKRSDQGAWRLIKREAAVLSKLKDTRGTPDFTKKGQLEDGCPYFLLRPNECRPLRELYRDLEAPQIIAGFRSLAKIVSKLHSLGLIHRNINLDTVFMDSFGRIQLRGFAYAIGRDERSPLATDQCSLETQAPEQLAKGAHVDQRADVYALGALLYQWLTGESPHGPDPDKSKIQSGILDPDFCEAIPVLIERQHRYLALDSVAQLADICLRCLALQPSDRYANVEQVLRTLNFFKGAPEMLDAFDNTDLAGSMGSGAHIAAPQTHPKPTPKPTPKDSDSDAAPSVTLAQLLASQQKSPIPEESQTMDLRDVIQQRKAPPPPPEQSSPATLFGESFETEPLKAPPSPKNQQSIATLFGESLEEDGNPSD